MPRSLWKQGIWQALNSLGCDEHYMEYARWIADNLGDITVPRYLARHGDIALAIKRDPNIRKRFQRDVNLVKADYFAPSREMSA